MIGPNGVGKSTLFKMIVGAAVAAGDTTLAESKTEQPTSGSIELGETVKLSLRRPDACGHRCREERLEVVSDGNDFIVVGKDEVNSRRLRERLRLQGHRPAEARLARFRAASVTD